MRRTHFVMLLMPLATATMALAQLPTYHLGTTPTPQEMQAVDTIVGPAGKELPPGSGTAKKGAEIFAKKCAHCHGSTGVEGQFPKLVGGALHPFATTIWSFINNGMPRSVPDVGIRAEILSADEVYALTAFILFRNGVVQETDVLDAKSLPRVRMPTRDPRLDKLVPPVNDAKN